MVIATQTSDNFTEDDPLRENGDQVIELSVKEKVIDFFKNVTLEPFLFLYIFSNVINSIATQNLYLEKSCRVNLAYSDAICDALMAQDLESQNEYEREVQKLLAQALAWKTYISATVPCVIALFAGSFSDKTGYRKVFFVIALTGSILVAINDILQVFFFYQLRLEYLVFSDVLIDGFTGGWCLTSMTSFAYISAITTTTNRTYRMGFISFSVTVAFPIGSGLSGIFLNRLGYYGCYGLNLTLHVINMLYLIFVIKNPPKIGEHKKYSEKGLCHLIRVFFSLSNVKDTFSVLYKKAPNNRRLRLCTLLGVVCVLFGPIFGEVSVMYMATRYRFNWNEVQYSLFQMYNFLTHATGTMFSLLLFSKHLKWHDSLLGIVATMSKIAASFVYCFAPNAQIFYVAPVADILSGTSLLSMRSIICKVVEPYELGKVSSLVGLVENLMPLVYVPLYTKVYTATMETLPGAVFLIGSAMAMPAILVLSFLFYEHRKALKILKRRSSYVED